MGKSLALSFISFEEHNQLDFINKCAILYVFVVVTNQYLKKAFSQLT